MIRFMVLIFAALSFQSIASAAGNCELNAARYIEHKYGVKVTQADLLGSAHGRNPEVYIETKDGRVFSVFFRNQSCASIQRHIQW